MRVADSRADAGFSLVETLIALALLALALALLPDVLRLSLQAGAAARRLDRDGDTARVLRVLETRISEAMPSFELTASGGVGLAFAGDSRSLTFIAPAEGGPTGAGLYRHSIGPLAAANAGGGTVLLLKLHAPGSGAAGEAGDATPREFRNLSVAFRYYGMQPADEPPRWHETWQQADALPLLVEIAVEARQGDARTTRRRIVAPRLNPAR